MKAIARLDWGRWLADCPGATCMNAMQLELGQPEFNCRFLVDAQRQLYGGCGTRAPIEWPADRASIEAEVAGRPQGTQNWRPEPTDD